MEFKVFVDGLSGSSEEIEGSRLTPELSDEQLGRW